MGKEMDMGNWIWKIGSFFLMEVNNYFFNGGELIFQG